MATKWQRVEIEIPDAYSRDAREAIAWDVIEFIRDRTTGKNVDKNNRPLAKYSEGYAKSLDFKIAGKSKGDVNFTQSGDTLSMLQLLESKPGLLVIGWENGSQANAIADGNIRGTYGNPSPIGPKRDILGITQGDLSRILKRFPLGDKDALDEQVDAYFAAKGDSGDE